MKDSITTITKSKSVDYSEEPVADFWQVKSDRSPATSGFHGQLISLLQSVIEGVVCIQSAALTDPEVIEQVLNMARGKRVKVYILVNQHTDDLKYLHGDCLIRYGLQNTGSFILVNPSSQQAEGIFFSGSLSHEALDTDHQIMFDLKPDEIPELFRHFCYHFWETAKQEVIEKEKHLEVKSKPMDIFHDPTAHGDQDFVYASLFEFVDQARRGDLSNHLIIPHKKENQSPIRIEPSGKHVIGEVLLSELLPQDEFERHTPELPDDGISCKVEYTWINVPYYLPDGSIRHALYEYWNNEQRKIQSRLDTILGRVEEAKAKEKTISAALKRFFLGKSNAFNQWKSDVEDLKRINYSSLPQADLKSKIEQINKISTALEANITEIDLEDHKAKLDDAINGLKETLSVKNQELEKSHEELINKEDEAAKALDAFLAKHGIAEPDLGKTKSHWGQLSGKKNKKKNPKEAEEAEANLNELKKIESKVFVEKQKSEIKNLEREIKRIEDDIKLKEQEKGKQPPKEEADSTLSDFLSKTPSSKKPDTGGTFSIKDLPQLPQVGELFQSGNQAYLAIQYWEEYDQGHTEAQRLQAKLCTTKN